MSGPGAEKLRAVKLRLIQLPLARQDREYSGKDRIIYAGLISLSGAVLLVGRWLTPSPRGVGTHEQLGLPPCAWLHLTGIPCPSCGLTTSVAHAARLHFHEAFVTQPFGLLVFGLALLGIPLSVYALRRRVPWSRWLYWRGTDLLLFALIALYLLSWCYKIAVLR